MVGFHNDEQIKHLEPDLHWENVLKPDKQEDGIIDL
jgi:hypothetical protein